MSDNDIPVVTDLSSLPMFGVSVEALTVRVGTRSYLFEKDPETREWVYVSNFPTSFPEDEEEPEPFNPAEWR